MMKRLANELFLADLGVGDVRRSQAASWPGRIRSRILQAWYPDPILRVNADLPRGSLVRGW